MSKKNKKGIKIREKSKSKLAKIKKKHHHKHSKKDNTQLTGDKIDEYKEATIEYICTVCKNSQHSNLRCPKIWRVYKPKEKSIYIERKIIPIHTMYCYNCGSKGHLGDDCTVRPFLEKNKDGISAFSGKNLHQTLQKIYYNMLSNQNDDNSTSSGSQAGLAIRRHNPKYKSFHFFRPPYQKK